MTSRRLLALPVVVMAAVSMASPALADTEFPAVTYAVPDAMGYGKYVASIGDGSSGCTYSTFDATGQPIDTVSTFAKPLTVAVDSTVASFRTKGCTPWVRVSRVLN